MTYVLGWKDILRPIRDGYRHLFPAPDTGPTPEEREKQRQLDIIKGFTYFDTFDQIEAWTTADCDPIQRSNTPLLARPVPSNKVREEKASILLCHDYAGNYHGYEQIQGSGMRGEGYSCEYLQYVDAFAYFSHKLVCVPPPSWTNTLHRNGVKVYGTLLIEPQTKDSYRLLRHDQNTNDGYLKQYFPMAKKLSDISKYHGFDGWLINVEKPFSSEYWNKHTLQSFLRQLKEEMGSRRELIWYDALTVENRVAYQNALTEKNIAFAAACGAILTNYCWKESDAWRSKDLAEQYGMPLERIYFGIDVWAQNKARLSHPRVTFPENGGGGTNTGVGVHKIAEIGVSAGIFAPGWTFEHFPNHEREMEGVMWDGHAPSENIVCSCGDGMLRHPPNQRFPVTVSAKRYPVGSEDFFYTDFSRAFSRHGEEETRRVYDGSQLHWQLGSQSILPHSLSESSLAGHNILSHRLVDERGRARLAIEAQCEMPLVQSVMHEQESYLPIFDFDMPIPEAGALHFTISFTYNLRIPKAISSFRLKFADSETSLTLTGSDGRKTLCYTIFPDKKSISTSRFRQIGIHVRAPVLGPDLVRILDIEEVLLRPKNAVSITGYMLDDVLLKRHGHGDSKHWRLRWSYHTTHKTSVATSSVPHSDVTGPFSYFQVRVDGVDVGRAYALEHVLPNALMASLEGCKVDVIVKGVGFDGRELASVVRAIFPRI